MFAYTVGLAVTQSKNLDFREPQGARAKTLCAKLRTIANDSKPGQEPEPEMSASTKVPWVHGDCESELRAWQERQKRELREWRLSHGLREDFTDAEMQTSAAVQMS